jgi:hypothetical protein
MLNDSTKEKITKIDDVFSEVEKEIEKINTKKEGKLIQFKKGG